MQLEYIWIIQNSENSNLIACFLNKNDAEKYIQDNHIKCMLTQYPVNISVYDWVISNDYWTPKIEPQKSAAFKANFSSAYLEHDHYNQD